MVEEFLVGADGVAREQRPDSVRREPQHVFGDLAFRLFEAQAVLPFVDEPRTGVHGAHEVVHVRDGGVGRLDDVVHAFVQHVEVEIGRHH